LCECSRQTALLKVFSDADGVKQLQRQFVPAPWRILFIGFCVELYSLAASRPAARWVVSYVCLSVGNGFENLLVRRHCI